nr:MAG TPA: hypothetical protein [Caudoviricetes sp.]
MFILYHTFSPRQHNIQYRLLSVYIFNLKYCFD